MNPRIIIYAIMVCLLTTIFFSSCSDSDPASSTFGYPEAVEQNIDVVQLIQAIQNLEQVPGIKSIVLGRNGVIAAQEYFNDAGADSIHDVRSVTKSVMGLLIGIAIEEGFIESVNQTVGEFFIGTVVDSLEPAKAQITIEQLLTMSCGLEWHELDGGNSYSNWYGSSDHVSWVLNRDFIHQPGNGFNYNTGSTHLLSVILTLASGQTALDFAQTHLFEPMGIVQNDWTIIVDQDEEELNNGGAGLKISPHAMFDIGNLVLNNGIWNQVQIVPSEWINKCISIQNSTNNAIPYGTEYGYLWWIGQAHGYNHFFAMGWGGQFIVCVPDLNLVVVATCVWQGVSSVQAGQNWYEIFIIIMDQIVPAVNE
jgi:CubicO group peptidase (beta-lactamase class C family)